jgi:uncharacterized protein (DUF3084 family)
VKQAAAAENKADILAAQKAAEKVRAAKWEREQARRATEKKRAEEQAAHARRDDLLKLKTASKQKEREARAQAKAAELILILILSATRRQISESSRSLRPDPRLSAGLQLLSPALP